MVQVSLNTASERKQVITEVTNSIHDIFAQNDVDTTGATVMLNGNIVNLSEFGLPLSNFGVQEGTQCFLNVAVKTSAA